jgi:DNA polymerase-3 subunit delta'
MSWNLIGHEWASDVLKKHIQNGNVRHAYLFCGPDGVGRRSLALRFTQALTCPQAVGTGEPCQTCPSCQRISRMQHPDLFVVSVPEGRKEILIEQVRSLQHDLSLAPYEAAYRIGLLLNFQNASVAAQNAMLKTLEEPTSRSILLLTASRSEDLLPTISSRCEVMLLRSASLEETALSLEKETGMIQTQAEKIARLAGGCYGQALALHQNPESIVQIKKFIDGMLQAMAAPLRERFAYAEELSSRKSVARENLKSAIQVWISFWRDVLLINGGADAPIIHMDYRETLDELAGEISPAEIHSQLSRLEEALDHLEKNANARLLAEILVMDLPHLRLPMTPTKNIATQ